MAQKFERVFALFHGIEKNLIVNETIRNLVTQRKVEQNHEIFKVLFNDVLFLAKQELPFRGNNEDINLDNRVSYIDLLRYFAKLKSVFEFNLYGSSQLTLLIKLKITQLRWVKGVLI